MRCVNHPERTACAYCQKFGYGYCRDCCRCTDPKTYCVFRNACIIWKFCEKGDKSVCPDES